VASSCRLEISCASPVNCCWRASKTSYFFFAGAAAAVIGAVPLNMSAT
jgi:hypothetical protein